MGSTQQPFLYDAVSRDSRSPTRSFDPKAVTRTSYTPKAERPKSNGPLLSVNVHPDAHVLLGQRFSDFTPMSGRTKKWIVALRYVQLFLRILELGAAVGLLVLMILVTNVDELAGWILRIMPCVVICHCVYAIYHLARAAGRRTPGSSAAYHVFAGIADLSALPILAYGVLTIRNSGDLWTTRLSDQGLMEIFLPVLYYTMIATGGLHLLSLTISLWLGVMFRRISLMPPDLNPLEDRFTSRAKHKRNKSSVATTSTMESEKRLSVPLEERRRSGAPYETLSRPPSIPFMHTRRGSEISFQSRDSRTNLPSRQSGISVGASARNSAQALDLDRLAQALRGPINPRGSYTEIPLHDSDSSRPSSATLGPGAASPASRTGKFTESWYASESLISRTQQRNRAMMKAGSNVPSNNSSTNNVANPHANAKPKARRTYEALSQRYDFPVSEESDADSGEDAGDENIMQHYRYDARDPYGPHPPSPNPLGSHPLAPPPRQQQQQRRPNTPFRPHRSSALSEVTLSDRNVSGASNADGQDVADAKPSGSPPPSPLKKPAAAGAAGTRLSSIQPESAFFSKPYGELKAATPPLMVVGGNRQVSSGNDFDGPKSANAGFARRNVSGKIAEEGRVSEEMRRSRFSVLNKEES